MPDDKLLCYPNTRDDWNKTLQAEPQRTICHCGNEIERDEKGVWRHVR